MRQICTKFIFDENKYTKKMCTKNAVSKAIVYLVNVQHIPEKNP